MRSSTFPSRYGWLLRGLAILLVAGGALAIYATAGSTISSSNDAGAGCYTLTTNVGAGGMLGVSPTSSGGCPTGQYSSGYPVFLDPVPSPGYVWSSWTGTDNDTVRATTVTMNGDRTVTVTFASNCYTLTTNVGAGGTLGVSPTSSGGCPTGQYSSGYPVFLDPVPSSGYVWSSWSGTDNDSVRATTVTMNGDRTVTVTFASNCYSLTKTIGSGSGTIVEYPTSSGGCPARQYSFGYIVFLESVPASGSSWVSWTGTDNDTVRATTVTMNGNQTVTAYFSGAPNPTPTSTQPVAGSTPTPTTAAGLVGDANCDGVVNSIDAALVLQFTAGLIGSLACESAADVNGDGAINAIDAAVILQFAAGQLSSL